MFTDYYDLFERFSIMAEQPDNTRLNILAYLKPRTTKALYERLLKETR